MKKSLILLTVLLTVFACSVREKPEFLRVENIDVTNSNSRSITLKAEAFFKNPNDIGGTLNSSGIHVLINDIDFGNISSKDFDIPAREEFSIPLEITVSTKDLLEKDKAGLIGGVLNSLLSKKVNVQYKGQITYKALGFSYSYPIDITQDVKIKL